ncbi:MAG: hypothetical protein H0W50_12120, partial [Parachlamydiaceae bacterium]|nr:hypothetical protein [Parachlamydiaceae bacterium]
ISDAGGYFKEGGNLAIARQMAKVNGNSVVFYNERNEQTETNGTVEVLLSESKTPIPMRSTFLDQCHTTGADVKQKPNADGLVTIGGNMLLRDLLQAVWRLRGLEKAQRVKFIISKEVESIIRQSLKKNHAESLTMDLTLEKNIAPLCFDDILRFVITNQVKQQGKDNFKALRQELTSVVQSLLLDLLLDNEFSVSEKAKAFSMLEGEWITEASQSPKDLYGIICHEEESDFVLKQEQEKFIDQINLIFSALPFLEAKGIKKTTALARIQEVCLAHAHSLPAKVLVPLRNMDSDQTVEIEQEMEQEAQAELEVQEHHETEKIELGYITYQDDVFIERWAKVKVGQMADQILLGKPMSYCPYFEMKDYCLFDLDLKDFSDAFEGVYVSVNAMEWPKKMPRLTDLKLLGRHRTPLHYVQVINGGKDLIILSPADAAMEIEHHPDVDRRRLERYAEEIAKMETPPEGQPFDPSHHPDDLYNLTLGFLSGKKPIAPELFEKIVKVKFLDGESSYLKPELEFLKKWFDEHGVEKMRTLFQCKILAGFPEKTVAYSNSNLRELLRS